MGKHNQPAEEVEVEFSISMHCNACERKVAKVVSKIKGVERLLTDMRNHRVVVTGRFHPEKVLKKLKKKTGKRVEIVVPEPQGEGEDGNGEGSNSDADHEDTARALLMEDEADEDDWCDDISVFSMFSDENANGCSIM